MYLAKIENRRKENRYVIRQSYEKDNRYHSRDLYDLGDDPSRFIVCPGGNSFYIDPVVEEGIEKKGVVASQEDLEPLFLRFLPFHIRRAIRGFDRSDRSPKDQYEKLQVDSFHPFDIYRLQYLKLEEVRPGSIHKLPVRFYATLHRKSRDEIEHDFILAERILKSNELARYTYQIFQLHQYFDRSFAKSHPEFLDQQQLDRYFLKALCHLNGDETFQLEGKTGRALHPHLFRYAIIYFDNPFLSRDPFRSFLNDFMNRHRIHRPPDSVQISIGESACLFGVTEEKLKKMGASELTKAYRKLAMKHHPDKGGNPKKFVTLSEAYNKLMKRKRGR